MIRIMISFDFMTEAKRGLSERQKESERDPRWDLNPEEKISVRNSMKEERVLFITFFHKTKNLPPLIFILQTILYYYLYNFITP